MLLIIIPEPGISNNKFNLFLKGKSRSFITTGFFLLLYANSNIMKNTIRLVLLAVITLLCFSSCKFKLTYDQAGMDELNKELTAKFGANAWYSEITVASSSEDETMVRVKETADPNSLKGKAWLKQADSWIPVDDILFQFNDNQPENHLFQLGKQVSLETLLGLISRSEQQLKQKGNSDARIHFISIQSAVTVKTPASRILYTISFRNRSNDKSYSFVYDLNGKLLSVNE